MEGVLAHFPLGKSLSVNFIDHFPFYLGLFRVDKAFSKGGKFRDQYPSKKALINGRDIQK